jgi:hypothetical protein
MFLYFILQNALLSEALLLYMELQFSWKTMLTNTKFILLSFMCHSLAIEFKRSDTNSVLGLIHIASQFFTLFNWLSLEIQINKTC